MTQRPSPQQSTLPTGQPQTWLLHVCVVGQVPQLIVPQPLEIRPHSAPCAAHVVFGTHTGGQFVTVPLHVKLVAVTLHGTVLQVNT